MALDEDLMKLAANAIPKPKIRGEEQEFGVPGDLPFTTFDEFLGQGRYQTFPNNRIAVDALVEMRHRDGTARALWRLLTLPIRSALREAEWVAPEIPDNEKTPPAGKKPPTGASTAVPPTNDQGDETSPTTDIPPTPLPQGKAALDPTVKMPGDDEVDFANQMFSLPPSGGGMTVSLTKLVRQTLLALFEGFSAFEEVRYVPDVGPLKGKIVLKKLAHRNASTVKFLTDEQGGYAGFRQQTINHGRMIDVIIDQNKSWYFAANEEENPYYGVSYFESAWHHYDTKRKLYYIAHIAAQFAAVKGRVGKYPPTSTKGERDKFRTALANFAFNTAVTIPHDYEVDAFDGGTGFDFVKLIEHHNTEMAVSILAKFLHDESRQVLIDNKQIDQAADFFVMQLEAIMNEIAESWSHYLMPKFIDWNFGSGIYPIFRFGVLADSTKDVIKEMLITVATAQSSMLTDEFIREAEKKMAARLGLEVDYDAVAEREAAEKAKQDALTQSYYGSGAGGGFGDQQNSGGPGDQNAGGGGPPGGGGGPPQNSPGGFPPG